MVCLGRSSGLARLRLLLISPGPEVTGTDRDHQNADQATDQSIRETGLDSGAGICASQAARTERDTSPPVRGNRAVLMDRKDRKGDDAGHRGHECRCQGSGSNLRWPPAGADQERCQDRAAADAVNPAHAAHCGREGDQDRNWDSPDPVARIVGPGWPGESQPDPERPENGAHDQIEDAGAGQLPGADNRS